MNVNMSLSKDKRKLQVTVILPERNLVTDEILTKSRMDIISMVESKYPEFVFVSGPRKVTNREAEKLSATWAFEMAAPAPKKQEPQSKKPAPRRKKATTNSNKS